MERTRHEAHFDVSVKDRAVIERNASLQQDKISRRTIAKMNHRKRRKTTLDSDHVMFNEENMSPESSSTPASIEGSTTTPHPSGSKTLELHQNLPPNAYFEPSSASEEPAWRCGIKHPMGHYYNAGDRKACAGCFTALSHNPNARIMDFYLPRRTYFYQPAPGMIWKPSKCFLKERRCKNLSHNSIAKEAFWEANRGGATDEEALKAAIEAIETHLRPKPPPVKVNPPSPTPSDPSSPPLPPLPLPPHPSGSKTMEHGQSLPESAYLSAKEENEVPVSQRIPGLREIRCSHLLI